MVKNRNYSVFNISFLDVMSCGFGAATLLFLIINNLIPAANEAEDLRATADLITRQIKQEESKLSKTQSNIKSAQQRLTTIVTESNSTTEKIKTWQKEINKLRAKIREKRSLEKQLSSKVKALEKEKDILSEQHKGRKPQVLGKNNKQYLNGLKFQGKHTLILLDISASMLDRTLVNVIRLRNLEDEYKKKSAKWQRALRTLKRLVALIPKDTKFQVYGFNTTTIAVLSETENTWLSAADSKVLVAMLEASQDLVPNGGTNLYNAFASIKSLSPYPENIILIADGLPTQGKFKPSTNLVSGKLRRSYFNQALKILPPKIPINVILFPMEGDPFAAAAFWNLAINTKGYFISPTKDWP